MSSSSSRPACTKLVGSTLPLGPGLVVGSSSLPPSQPASTAATSQTPPPPYEEVVAMDSSPTKQQARPSDAIATSGSSDGKPSTSPGATKSASETESTRQPSAKSAAKQTQEPSRIGGEAALETSTTACVRTNEASPRGESSTATGGGLTRGDGKGGSVPCADAAPNKANATERTPTTTDHGVDAVHGSATDKEDPNKEEERGDEGEEEVSPTARKRSVQVARLSFASKKSAGSSFSEKQASIGIARQSSITSQKARDAELTEDNVFAVGEEFPVSKSSSISGLIPRAPTGTERWEGKKRGRDLSPRANRHSESDVIGLQDALVDADKQAAAERKKHDLYMAGVTLDGVSATYSVAWESYAVSNLHFWHEVDSREACHLHETQFCQEAKHFHPRRIKVRCSACKILAHICCIKQLYYEGYTCKETFREIKQKTSTVNVLRHHFLHRRKASGRCKKCEKGFGNWKKFSGREIVGMSCSWCGDSYHMSCFNDALRMQNCHYGNVQNLVIPPTWIIKVPYVERQGSKDSQSEEGGGGGGMFNRRKKSTRKTRRRTRHPPIDRASKNFVIKPLTHKDSKPLLVFINPKSGGNQGAKLIRQFQWLLNPRQVFDLSKGGPSFGLKLYGSLPNVRILACGGDGTAGWILSVLDSMAIKPLPPVAVLPLGTGNDLARVLGWGGGYTDEPLEKILMHVEEGQVINLDRWHLSVWDHPNMPADSVDIEGTSQIPLEVINNYFSIGADAHVALEFHLEREANPEKYSKRYKNKFFYTKLAGQDMVVRRYSNLTDSLKLVGDGKDLTGLLHQHKFEAICFLNISSYAAGCNPWGNPSPREIGPQKLDDGCIEVIGFWAWTFPKMQVGLAHGYRIAQCQHVKMTTSRSLPVQVDGEACKLKPSVLEVVLKNKMPMVKKGAIRKLVQAPLYGIRPSDQIKLSVSKVTDQQYRSLHSDLLEIKREAVGLGLVMVRPTDTLLQVRPQVERFVASEYESRSLASNWRFLDVATGRMDRLFQVMSDQEESICIGDVLLDGVYVVELPQHSPACSPGAKPKLLSHQMSVEPACQSSACVTMSSDISTAAVSNATATLTTSTSGVRRGTFGRTTSYNLATSADNAYEYSGSRKLLLSDSSEKCIIEEENGYEGDSETNLCAISQLMDTGSESVDTDSEFACQKALVDAIKRGNLEQVKKQHSKGAKLTLQDHYSWTPLHHAARLGKIEIVKYLLDNMPRGAVDIVDDEKLQTPLHKAAWYGYFDICKLLVEHGASLTRLDYKGNTPYDKSVESEDKELQSYLQGKERELLNVTDDSEVAV